jgi:Zn-dependent metalloprotease
MTETAEVTPDVKTEPVKVDPPKDDSLDKAREAERNRFSREEMLRRELEDKNRRLDEIKKNGWDLELLSSKKPTEPAAVQTDIKKELEELKKEVEQERTLRQDVQELQAILDFTSRSDKYELIKNLEDAPKYVQMAMREHLKNTGKRLSYEEACDYIEGEIEKAEVGRFEKFSKTKKAASIYKLKNAETEKPTLTKPTSKVTTQEPPEPSNLHRSNSREAFNYFKKKYGFK